jgi:peptidoglycan/xylan/chitin deacetylase (PgdA/CDA1 family)
MPIIISNKEIKHGIIGFAEATLGNFMRVLPVLNNVSRFKKDSLRIVYYHIVSSETREYYFDNKTISPKVFREHLAFFKKRFHIISLAEALQMVENKESLHGKLVLTFDDGFAENYTVIAPILKEQGITGTLFLIGNCIDNKDLMWRNKLVVIQKKAASKLPKLTSEAIRAFFLPSMRNKEGLLEWSFRTWPMNKKDEIANFIWDGADIGTIAEYVKEKKPYLTIEQIRYLLNEGFEIGSHSLSHPVFSRLSYDEFKGEIVTSAKLLEATFGKQITSFSYPFGMKACPEFEQRLIKDGGVAIKTLLGTKNRLDNYMNCLQWERDNLEFPMNKMLFRLNLLPLLRRLE